MDAPDVVVARVTDTGPLKLPPLGLIVGVATAGGLTVRLKVVVRVTPPPTAETVIVEVPPGVVPAVVLMVRSEEHVGVQLGVAKAAVAPTGRPDAEYVTDWAVPVWSVALAKNPMDDPAVTEELPLFVTASEKSKGCVMINAALATPLGL